MTNYNPGLCDVCKKPLAKSNIKIEFWFEDENGQIDGSVKTIVDFITYHRSGCRRTALTAARDRIKNRLLFPHSTVTCVETRKWLEAFRSLTHWETGVSERFTQLLDYLDAYEMFTSVPDRKKQFTKHYIEMHKYWWNLVMTVGKSTYSEKTLVTYPHARASDRVLCYYSSQDGSEVGFELIDLDVVHLLFVDCHNVIPKKQDIEQLFHVYQKFRKSLPASDAMAAACAILPRMKTSSPPRT